MRGRKCQNGRFSEVILCLNIRFSGDLWKNAIFLNPIVMVQDLSPEVSEDSGTKHTTVLDLLIILLFYRIMGLPLFLTYCPLLLFNCSSTEY